MDGLTASSQQDHEQKKHCILLMRAAHQLGIIRESLNRVDVVGDEYAPVGCIQIFHPSVWEKHRHDKPFLDRPGAEGKDRCLLRH